jgi:penicillin amidase
MCDSRSSTGRRGRTPGGPTPSLRLWLIIGSLVAAHLVSASGRQAAPGAVATPPAETVESLAAASRAALANIDGEARIEGLAQPVEVVRDRWGVPHIYAKTLDDLFTAQGYVAAQDRLWQLDLWRRVAMGELSEVFGPRFVERDTFARLLRYRGDPDKEWSSYSPDARRIAESFVRGINARVSEVLADRAQLPVEFQLTGGVPEPWTPDVVISRMAGYIMTRGARTEVQRAQLAARVGASRVGEFLPSDPPVQINVPDGLDLADITDDVLRITHGAGDGLRTLFAAASQAASISPWPAWMPSGGHADRGPGPLWASVEATRDELATIGSNNWVVAGNRSVTGRPLLANDPHRSLQVPSLRYTVHLNGPGWNVIGAGEPALPGVAVGHNDRIAFGFTVVGIDQQDLYVERTDTANPDRVARATGFEPMRVEQERIEVRGESPRSVELRFTRYGPVLHVDRARHRAYALRWVGTEPGTAGYLASLSLNVARNWDEFQAAAARWAVPSENLVYADVDGNVGWVVAGLTPARKGWNGLLPVPGHEGRFEWGGFVPANELPRAFNPAGGVIATANHNILPPGYAKVLGYDWAPPFRYQRIAEALALRPKWNVAGFEALQHDEVSLPAARVIDALRVASATVPFEGADRAFAVKMLTSWDGTLSGTSAPAALYELWLPHLQRALVPVAYKPDERKHAPERLTFEQTIARLQKPTREDLAVLVGPALDAAFNEAKEKMGPKPAEWQWQRLHYAEFRHPLSTTDARRTVFDLPPVPRGGDASTVNNTGFSAVQVHGASFRAVMDVGDWDRSTMINVPGQSGQPGSRHYADLLPLWGRGQYHPMLFSREAVEQHAAARLILRPGVPTSERPRPYPTAADKAPPPAPSLADAPPRMPPFAGTLVNYDRRGGRTAACALDPGGGETKRGARAIPNTHVWVFERELVRELGSSPGTCDPVWSPDGSRLAVVAPNGLWTYSPALDDPRLLAETSLPAAPKHEHDYTAFARPRWSPDGQRIAFLVTDGAASWVEVVDVASTRRVFKSPPGVTIFAWGESAGILVIDGQATTLPR